MSAIESEQAKMMSGLSIYGNDDAAINFFCRYKRDMSF